MALRETAPARPRLQGCRGAPAGSLPEGRRLLLVELGGHVGLDVSRRDGVAANVPRRQLPRHALGEPEEARLGRGVVRLARVPHEAHHRAHVHDHSVAELHHATRYGPRHVEGALEVGVDDLIPVLILQAKEDVVAGDPRIVHEDAHRTQGLFHRCHRLCCRHRVGHVAAQPQVPLAGEPCRRLVGPCLVASEHGHPGTALGQGPRNGQPDPPGSARDDGDRLVQFRHAGLQVLVFEGGSGFAVPVRRGEGSRGRRAPGGPGFPRPGRFSG
jgi:hypothetical protein